MLKGKTLAGVEMIDGWVLITRDETDRGVGNGDWYIAWLEIFTRKRDALAWRLYT